MILLLTGPPGAGKTTEAAAWAAAQTLGLHLPVDDMRLWVKGGLADSVPWTDESERQFQMTERAAWTAARIYAEAGCAVAVDHCRNLPRLNALCEEHWQGLAVRRVLLLPDLEENLRRNRERTNKDFDPAILEETIRAVHAGHSAADQHGWEVFSTVEPGFLSR